MTPSRSNWTGIAFGLSLASFAAYQQFKLPPALPVLLETYGYDRALAGAFMSVYAVAGLLLSILLGRLIERAGIIPPTLIALALMAAGSLLSLWLPENGWVVLAGRALEGIGFAAVAIIGPLLAHANASARHLPLVVGMTASWIPVGQLGAVLIAPLAFAWYGWQMLWVVAIAGTVLLAAWTLKLRGNSAIHLLSAPPVSPKTSAAARPHSQGLSKAQRRGLILAAGVFTLWSSQYFAYMTWLPQYLVEVHGLSPSMAVFGYTVPVVVLIATTLLTGMVLRGGFPVGPLLALGLACQAAIWWLIPVTGGGMAGLGKSVV